MTISFEVLESLPDLVVAPEQQVLRKTKGDRGDGCGVHPPWQQQHLAATFREFS